MAIFRRLRTAAPATHARRGPAQRRHPLPDTTSSFAPRRPPGSVVVSMATCPTPTPQPPSLIARLQLDAVIRQLSKALLFLISLGSCFPGLSVSAERAA